MTKLGSNGTGQTPPPSRAPPLAIAKTETCFLPLGDGVTGRDRSTVRYGWGGLDSLGARGWVIHDVHPGFSVGSGIDTVCALPHSFPSGPLCWIFDPLVPQSWGRSRAGAYNACAILRILGLKPSGSTISLECRNISIRATGSDHWF